MLGIAHVGFVRILELAGIRFLGVGGASAGAINAVLVAATRRRPDEESWRATQEVRACVTEVQEFFTAYHPSESVFRVWSL